MLLRDVWKRQPTFPYILGWLGAFLTLTSSRVGAGGCGSAFPSSSGHIILPLCTVDTSPGKPQGLQAHLSGQSSHALPTRGLPRGPLTPHSPPTCTVGKHFFLLPGLLQPRRLDSLVVLSQQPKGSSPGCPDCASSYRNSRSSFSPSSSRGNPMLTPCSPASPGFLPPKSSLLPCPLLHPCSSHLPTRLGVLRHAPYTDAGGVPGVLSWSSLPWRLYVH